MTMHYDPKMAFRSCDLLDHEGQEQYICDPFNKIHQHAYFHLLSFQPSSNMVDDNEVVSKSCTCFTKHQNKALSKLYKLTGEVANGDFLINLESTWLCRSCLSCYHIHTVKTTQHAVKSAACCYSCHSLHNKCNHCLLIS